jgi:hypothetical protein
MVPDRTERETVINAPVERVWDLITEPEHVGRWFGDAGAEIDPPRRPRGPLHRPHRTARRDRSLDGAARDPVGRPPGRDQADGRGELASSRGARRTTTVEPRNCSVCGM